MQTPMFAEIDGKHAAPTSYAHRPEAGPAAAVSLSPCPLESQSGELCKGRLGGAELQRSRSAPLHYVTTTGVLVSGS
jgi:hypothetical protein